jgi:hypothetical protein
MDLGALPQSGTNCSREKSGAPTAALPRLNKTFCAVARAAARILARTLRKLGYDVAITPINPATTEMSKQPRVLIASYHDATDHTTVVDSTPRL